MTTLLRIFHLLALGLWFGSVAFFSFATALPIIRTMEANATRTDYWLDLKDKRAGTRLAGDALTPVFDNYFRLQVICGAIALCTAPWWTRVTPRVGWTRRGLLLMGFLLACINAFFLAPRVHELRAERYHADSTVAAEAETAFGRWHTCSLGADMAGLACVTAALASAAAGRKANAEQLPPHAA